MFRLFEVFLLECMSYVHKSVLFTQFFFLSCVVVAQPGLWPPHSSVFQITHNDASQSVRLLWTSDQLVAETFTWQPQYSQQTEVRSPTGFDFRSKQGNGRRTTPLTARSYVLIQHNLKLYLTTISILRIVNKTKI